jgi:cellulose synthase (UDP-forming)
MSVQHMTRQDRRMYRLIGIIGISLTAIFAITWFSPSNIPQAFQGYWWFLNIVFFALTTYVVWHEIVAGLYTFQLLGHIKPYKYISPQKNLKVAFITTFVPGKEPHSMLRSCLKAIAAVDYDHDTWVLDEGNDPLARRICKELGVKYFTRNGIAKYNTVDGKFASKTKGGNHNAWYDAHGFAYDIVAQVDTDFIVKKNFLTETLGQFRNPRIAFVGTPQYYGNGNSGLVAKGAAEQTFNFYGPILRGQSGSSSPHMIGANHIVRVSALKSIDWYAAHLTEDLLTGMRLYADGWKGVYCPKVLAVGEGPTTWDAFFAQQMRWAHGCFDILFRHAYKILPKLGVLQQLRLFISLQHYFSGFNLVIGSLLLILYFLFGIQTANYSMINTLLIYVPLLLWLYATPLWYHRFNIYHKRERGFMLAGKVINLAVQPIFFMAFLGAARNKRITFHVTPKGQDVNDSVSFKLFRFHIALGVLSLTALIIGLMADRVSYVLIFWAVANTIIAIVLTIIVISSKIRLPKPTPTLREVAK